MTTHEDSAAAYVAVRERMTELMRQTSSEELARQVPACPDWSVQDLLAHVAGVAVD
ncbi:maleylpyruvate isomerase N-terminal domain-containing protein, partial [Aeromicrobium sp.]|uniref:maleylpyruvate isomerase N-terminal domain-containing protein n=1 Tax=Aeromicrobium sp. TaxID=1871063 RepID=UPI003C6F3FDE